jgi:FkbM family methyltransferase
MSQKVLFEIGSYDGTDSLQFYKKGYTVYTFEPKKDLYEALKAKTTGYNGYKVINKAVSLVDGPVDFNICAKGGASSILQFKQADELLKHWGPNRKDILYSGQSYTVESTRLDTFIEQNGLETTTIDYIHVDAQGADLDVMKSLGVYVSNVVEGVIESAYSAEKTIYQNQQNVVETATEWLKENGFHIRSIERNDSTLCECNIYFSRYG